MREDNEIRKDLKKINTPNLAEALKGSDYSELTSEKMDLVIELLLDIRKKHKKKTPLERISVKL